MPVASKIAYSYLRFSSMEQADGDSIRRQTALAEAWCKRNGVVLDDRTTFTDKGKSAYRGKHRETGVLARFLVEVEAGRVQRGSYLIVENLDRLSRENPWDAVPLLCGIVNAGIIVVTLSPSEVVYERGRDLTPLVLAVIEFGRGHSESAVKGERVVAAWDAKRDRAREGKHILTKNFPAWLELRDGVFVPNAEKVRLIKRIFSMAIGGYGLSAIVKTLATEGVQPFGRAKWTKAYIHGLLRKRHVLGELQLRKGQKPDGSPILNYYPAVIDVKTWERAQGAVQSRKGNRGRVGVKVASLFTGLLWDVRTKGKMLIALQPQNMQRGGRPHCRLLVPAGALEGRVKFISLPNEVFETEVLSLLKEVKPADILGQEPESKSSMIAADLFGVEARIREIEVELTGDSGDVPALVKVMKTLDSKRQNLMRQLAEERQKEASPTSSAWGEAKSLLDAARSEQDRLRLRALLRQIIERIDLLIVTRGKKERLCAVQIRFTGGARRDYLIHYQSAGRARPSRQQTRSVPWEATGKNDGSEMDLRNDKHAQQLEAVLQQMPLSWE